jgi:hypothetical protein
VGGTRVSYNQGERGRREELYSREKGKQEEEGGTDGEGARARARARRP